MRISDFGPKSGPKPNEAKPIMPRAVPTNRHETIPIDFGPISVCARPRSNTFERRDRSAEPDPSGGRPSPWTHTAAFTRGHRPQPLPAKLPPPAGAVWKRVGQIFSVKYCCAAPGPRLLPVRMALVRPGPVASKTGEGWVRYRSLRVYTAALTKDR